MAQPFKITVNKYKLRKTPELNDTVTDTYLNAIGNVILELAIGDEGIALAEEADETGRIWWFVQMKNNIKKPLEDYYYIDSRNEHHRIKEGDNQTLDNPIFGWVSSRYLEKSQN